MIGWGAVLLALLQLLLAAPGMAVKRGQVFANVADMGDRTHFQCLIHR